MWIFPGLNSIEYIHIQDSWENLIKSWLNLVYSKSLLAVIWQKPNKGYFSYLLSSINSKFVCRSSNKPGQCYPKSPVKRSSMNSNLMLYIWLLSKIIWATSNQRTLLPLSQNLRLSYLSCPNVPSCNISLSLVIAKIIFFIYQPWETF